jgi:hypothetical protein
VGSFLSKLGISAAFSCIGHAFENFKTCQLKRQEDELQNNSFEHEIVQNLAELWLFQAKLFAEYKHKAGQGKGR